MLPRDQVWPKRCGHMRGKKVIPRNEYLEKIKAAAEARRDRDFFIVARTDALGAVNIDEAVARAESARALGANATFIEAPRTLDELAEVGRRAPKPTVANMIEQGKTPVLPRAELADLGFQLILYPLAGLYASAKALQTVFDTLRTDETTTRGADALIAFDAFNEIIGVDQKFELAERFGEGKS